MTEDEAMRYLVDVVAESVTDRMTFVTLGHLFPPETRTRAAQALKALGHNDAAQLIDSITGTQRLARLWDE